jgi:hypothetical protein
MKHQSLICFIAIQTFVCTPALLSIGPTTASDMRNFSLPILSLSSGALPGQISTTSGLSAPTADQATHRYNQRNY